MEQGGTWLGVTRSGRFAGLTNYRAKESRQNLKSRGHLVADFLTGELSPEDYCQTVIPVLGQYAGFNLLVGDFNTLFYLSNRDQQPYRQLPPGLYGLSNHLLDTPWPKVKKGKQKLADALAQIRLEEDKHPQHQPEMAHEHHLLALLGDAQIANDNDLPETGVGIEMERLLSSMFIQSPIYGTRASTVIRLNHQEPCSIWEQTYLTGGNTGELKQFSFELSR